MLESEFNPKVSIVIPVYNGANYLESAIKCALAQTYGNIEVLVINDGSGDEGATEEIALSFGDKIRYYSKPNGGVSSALNYGIKKMTGDYFSWLSHDDAYAPTKVADAVELLRQTPEADERTIAYTCGHYIDKNGVALKPFHNKLVPGKWYSGREMAYYTVENGTLNGCCMLIPRIAFEEFGGLDENLRYSQDTLMWYTLYFGGYSLVSDHKDNVMYRLHNEQVSRTRQDLFEHDAVYIAKKLAKSMVEHSTDGRELLYRHAVRMAKYNCVEVVRFLREYAAQGKRFSAGQNLRLSAQLFYGKFRRMIKRVYYHVILKADA